MAGTAQIEAQVEANKRTVARLLERIGAGDLEAFGEALTPGYVRHCQAMPPELQEIHGPEAMLAWLRANQATFPDYREELEYILGEGDFVAWRSRGTGTMNGPMGPFPPTGKRMELVIIGMHRFEGERVAETWTSWDNLAALVQLGLMPGAPA